MKRFCIDATQKTLFCLCLWMPTVADSCEGETESSELQSFLIPDFLDKNDLSLKAVLRFNSPNFKYLEITANEYGVYFENKAGDYGLPIWIVKTNLFVEGKALPFLHTEDECQKMILFPMQKKLWAKWPRGLDDLSQDPVRASISVELLR